MNYKVYQGTELKQTVTSKKAVMNGLQPNRTYEFGVEADNAQTGADGKTRYLHTAYADSADGKDGFYVGGGTNTNLWDRSKAVSGFLDSSNSGNIVTPDAENLVSDFISVDENQTYIYSTDVVITQPERPQMWNGYMFFDSNKAPLGVRQVKYFSNVTVGTSQHSEWVIKVPVGASFIRIGSRYLEHGRAKLEKGSVATPWSPAPSEAHPSYVGTYTDFTQSDSNNPSDYTWNPIQDGDATRDGVKETISVTTRGIRFNIPKTLTVGSNITLRYEEYPLGIVPIGNEPSGMFGGGNKQNLSAKVISTANGSSVVEVDGNVIEVGNKNLIRSSEFDHYWSLPSQATLVDGYDGHKAIHVDTTDWTNSGYVDVQQTIYNPDVQFIKQGEWYTISFYAKGKGTIRTHMYPSVIDVSAGSYADGVFKAWPTGDGMYDWPLTDKYVRHSWSFKTPTTITPTTNTGIMLFRSMTGNSTYVSLPKLEPGTIATPYAAFVDGDTFTAQPDGTCALISEYKALYY